MKQQLKKLETKLGRLTKRDQFAFFVTFLVVVMMIWFKLFYQPFSENILVVEQAITQKKTQLEALQVKMIALQKSISVDPDAENRVLIAKYQEENAQLSEAFSSTSIQFINPQDMASLLEQLLQAQQGLKFVSLKNKPAIAEFVESHDKSEAVVENVNTIYRHSMVLKMEGSYHDTLSYIKKLEQLPWRFFWQSIEIETSGYPNASITLEVYTLGFREGIVGA